MKRQRNYDMIAIVICIIIGVAVITSCSPTKDSASLYKDGFSDGYAVGYNTTCKIRATPIIGNWDDVNYTTGYGYGRVNGATDCRAGIIQ